MLVNPHYSDLDFDYDRQRGLYRVRKGAYERYLRRHRDGVFRAADNAVQHNSAHVASGASQDVSTLSNVTSGNLLVACMMGDQTLTFSTPVDTSFRNSTWTAGPTIGTAGNGKAAMWYTVLGSGGAETVTFAYASATGYIAGFLAEYANVGAAPWDTGNQATSSIAAATITSSGSVAQANEYVVAFIMDWNANTAGTAGANFTSMENLRDATGGDSAMFMDKNVITGLSGTQTWTGASWGTNAKQVLLKTFKYTPASSFTFQQLTGDQSPIFPPRGISLY